MLERSIPVLRIACLALAAVIVLQAAWLLARKDPLADVRIPNIAVAANPTNAPSATNSPRAAQAPTAPGQPTPTLISSASTSGPNSVVAPQPGPSALKAGAPPRPDLALARPGGPGGPMSRARGPGFGPGGPGGPGAQVLADLPPQVKARLERITQSQILGPVMHPPPMALLGIAGRDVFLRAPSGQTGLIREGEELGGVKLLQVGYNRVLVEVEGRKQELTIFSGLGSETLLPQGKENPQ